MFASAPVSPEKKIKSSTTGVARAGLADNRTEFPLHGLKRSAGRVFEEFYRARAVAEVHNIPFQLSRSPPLIALPFFFRFSQRSARASRHVHLASFVLFIFLRGPFVLAVRSLPAAKRIKLVRDDREKERKENRKDRTMRAPDALSPCLGYLVSRGFIVLWVNARDDEYLGRVHCGEREMKIRC